MEKKTIGKFIAALRKANGMTQKELGEKLFVSDKTVSRWERDECTPELSLIPPIADIFGVTVDELLRGERNGPNRRSDYQEESKLKAKSDKQFKLMIDKRKRKYKNLSLISIGITLLGIIATAAANLGFSKGLIAFCICTAFCIASEISHICFTVNARISHEDDDPYLETVQTFNTCITNTATATIFFNLSVSAFSLPLVTMISGAYSGLVFEYWLICGLLFSSVTFTVCYIIYTLFIRKILRKKNLITINENQERNIHKNNVLLVKTLAFSIGIALFLSVCILILNIIGTDAFTKMLKFDNCDDFKTFMQADYEKWYTEGYSHVDENGDVVEVPIISSNIFSDPSDEKIEEDYYPSKVYNRIKNSKGQVICKYYYNPNLYKDIIFTESSEDKMPVTVITNSSHYDALDTFQTIESTLYFLIMADFIVAALVYIIKIFKNKI